MCKEEGVAMNHLIIDTSEGDARVMCDEYGDFQVFNTLEDAEAYRQLMCDPRMSYVLPRTPCRGTYWRTIWCCGKDEPV